MKAEILAVVQKPPDSPFLASDFEKLVPKLPSLLEESRIVACKTAILSSLYFPEMRDRYDQIKEAENTFEWILQSNKPNLSGPAVNFVQWLRSQKPGDNTYWISGKPGSGKSTLMKFLYRHPQTKSILKQWADKKKLVMCGFYFWISGGSPMLKSQLGLLRSLVFEVLKGNPALIEVACQERYNAVTKENQYGPRTWTVEELLETLKKATSHGRSDTRFCFFIDGLDEYEGQPQDMIYLIRKFPKSPDIKFCLASRKWNAFIDEFGDEQSQKETPRHLFLEDLTREDIRKFVEQKFRAERKFCQMESKNPRLSKQLINDVVTKAEGVFLWVYLVVQSLIRGFVNADSVKTIQDRLNSIPGDLPNYFSAMLGNVESIYRADAAKIYQIMASTTEQPYLVMFHFLWNSNPHFGLATAATPYSLQEIREMTQEMRPQLNARCTDLLDIITVSGVHPLWQYKVVFLHRTVREYIEGQTAKEILGQWISQAKEQFDPDIYICHSLVAQIKRAPLKPQYLAEQGTVSQLIKQFAHSARRVQDTLGDPQVKLLNELEATLESYRRSQAAHATTYHTSFWYSKATFMQWADKENLSLYVSARANTDPSVVEDLNQPRLAMRRNTLEFGPGSK
ncbi:hypothetical protein CEP51_016133 [Fusarium floridanum]|uniref:Uncharacterized protein n=1 Tax=Fusarium floridanum TaxID=1325733 RepID=A0A428NWD9_9HYPO|nr:hypothetical protein CEP51_016133 [Fusarium floridanum]